MLQEHYSSSDNIKKSSGKGSMLLKNYFIQEKEQKLSDAQTGKKKKKAKTSMSFFTALSLSMNNLMTKRPVPCLPHLPEVSVLSALR